MSDYPKINSSVSSFQLANGSIDPDPSHELALTIAEAAEDRKGGNILVLRVADVSYLADYFVLITGFSKVQVRAISQAIQQKVQQKLQRSPLRMEGQTEGSWILQDYGDVIAHVLLPREREYYNLEAFWGHAERVELPAPSAMGE